MLAYTWHTGKPGAKGRVLDPDRDQIRRAAFLTFVVSPSEPINDTIKLAGLRWKLWNDTLQRRGVQHKRTLVYRRIGPRPACTKGG